MVSISKIRKSMFNIDFSSKSSQSREMRIVVIYKTTRIKAGSTVENFSKECEVVSGIP